jgi:hypothetical protein
VEGSMYLIYTKSLQFSQTFFIDLWYSQAEK